MCDVIYEWEVFVSRDILGLSVELSRLLSRTGVWAYSVLDCLLFICGPDLFVSWASRSRGDWDFCDYGQLPPGTDG